MPILICNAFGPGCVPDWNGVAAVATAAATGVALFAILREACRQRQARRSAIREACSAVDRLVAYHQVSGDIVDEAQHSAFARIALDRISESAKIQQDIIRVLIQRPDLSDGAIMAMAAALNVAEPLIELRKTYGVEPSLVQARKAGLLDAEMSCSIAKVKSADVREHFHWEKSKAARKIKEKYEAVPAKWNEGCDEEALPAAIEWLKSTAY